MTLFLIALALADATALAADPAAKKTAAMRDSMETCSRLLHEGIDSNRAAMAAGRDNDRPATCTSARKTLKIMREADRVCPKEYQPQRDGSELAAKKMVEVACGTGR